MRAIVESVLLILGIGIALASVVAMLLCRSVYERIHYLSALAVGAAPLVVAAVVVHAGGSAVGVKALVVLSVLLVSGPVVAHAIARAARSGDRERDDTRADADRRPAA